MVLLQTSLLQGEKDSFGLEFDFCDTCYNGNNRGRSHDESDCFGSDFRSRSDSEISDGDEEFAKENRKRFGCVHELRKSSFRFEKLSPGRRVEKRGIPAEVKNFG